MNNKIENEAFEAAHILYGYSNLCGEHVAFINGAKWALKYMNCKNMFKSKTTTELIQKWFPKTIYVMNEVTLDDIASIEDVKVCYSDKRKHFVCYKDKHKYGTYLLGTFYRVNGKEIVDSFHLWNGRSDMSMIELIDEKIGLTILNEDTINAWINCPEEECTQEYIESLESLSYHLLFA